MRTRVALIVVVVVLAAAAVACNVPEGRYVNILHAKKLYEANKAQTDSEWTSFFVTYLALG